jgi:hypothetical protein
LLLARQSLTEGKGAPPHPAPSSAFRQGTDSMSDDALRRPLPPSVFARLAQATRYAITGVSPDTWFGPLQPLAPMAPPEVKGRQFDYPFGANLNYIPRAEDGISFAELRGLADARDRIRSIFAAEN